MNKGEMDDETLIAREEDQIEVVYQFNNNPRKAINALCAHFQVEPTPANIARILRTTDGLLGDKIGDFLSRSESKPILVEYFAQCDLHGPYIAAMHVALSGPMFMPGESEMIDRVLQTFSESYLVQNPGSFPDADVPFVLAFALIMLNSDLHKPQVKRKMSMEDFISNTRNSLPEGSITDAQLAEMYETIRDHPFNFNDSNNEFLALCAPKLKGFLKKKSDKFSSTWVKHFFVLANSSLFYFKDNTKASKERPLGTIQLVEVDIYEEVRGKKILIMVESRSETGIQYAKFSKGKPQVITGIRHILFEAPDDKSRRSWFTRMKRSVIFSSFSNNGDLHMPTSHSFSSIRSPTDDSIPDPSGFDQSDFSILKEPPPKKEKKPKKPKNASPEQQPEQPPHPKHKNHDKGKKKPPKKGSKTKAEQQEQTPNAEDIPLPTPKEVEIPPPKSEEESIPPKEEIIPTPHPPKEEEIEPSLQEADQSIEIQQTKEAECELVSKQEEQIEEPQPAETPPPKKSQPNPPVNDDNSSSYDYYAYYEYETDESG